MTFTLLFFALLVFVAPQSVADSVKEQLQSIADSVEEQLDRFALFSDCTKMMLVVERLPSDASDIGLSDEVIQNAVESRLRSARLYRSGLLPVAPYLYVNVNVVGSSFSIGIEFRKRLFDRDFSDVSGSASTWRIGSTGTHGGDAGYIVSWLSQHVDRFLVEFLRVNEDACE